MTLFAFTSVFADVITEPTTHEIQIRDIDAVKDVIASLEQYTYHLKRDEMTPEELEKRESEIVTKILELIKDTELSPGIIHFFITDPALRKVAIDTIVFAIKHDLINLKALLKALNDSGLAVDVIRSVISNCRFYQQIYKLVLQQLSNLPNLIGNLLRVPSTLVANALDKRDIMVEKTPVAIYTRDSQELLVSLMESLKNSGLANQVVNALIVDDEFYTFGADLIEELLNQDALDFQELLEAIMESGLIESIFKAFLNAETLKTVMVNALAAAFNDCASATTTTNGGVTTTKGSTTATNGPAVTSRSPTTTTLDGGEVVICSWVKKS